MMVRESASKVHFWLDCSFKANCDSTKWQRIMVCYIKSTEWTLFLSANGRGQEQCCLESPERSVRFHNPYFSLKDSVFGIIYQSQWGGGTYTHTNTQVWYSPCWAHPLGAEERERQKEKEGLGIDVSLDNNNNNSIASQGHAEKSSQGAIKIHPLYWAPWTSRPSGLQSIRASRLLRSMSNLPTQHTLFLAICLPLCFS